MDMYQERVMTEKKNLDEKRSKLEEFIGTDKFRSLRESERILLTMQLMVMLQYSTILAQRIANFH